MIGALAALSEARAASRALHASMGERASSAARASFRELLLNLESKQTIHS